MRILGLAGDAGCGGQYFQAHLGAFLAADQIDHVVEPPADHIDHFPAAPLADAGNAVAGVESSRLVGRAAGHHAHDLGVFVLALQHCADAFQRQRHADLEVLHAARIHERGVGVVHGRHDIGVNVESVIGGLLFEPMNLRLVALEQQLARGLRLLAGGEQTQQTVLHASAPVVFGGLAIRQPGPLVGIYGQGLGSIEIELGVAFEIGHIGFEPLHQALLKAVVDLIGAVERGSLEFVVEARAAGLQLADIGRQQIGTGGIQMFQVEIEQLAGKAVVECQLAIVALVQLAHDLAQRIALGVAGGRRLQRLGGPGQQQASQQRHYRDQGVESGHGFVLPLGKGGF